MGARYDRHEPRRRDTKDSWITIDWGKKQPPSSLHGVLDQIAGHLLRDHRLVEQGKRELRKAAEYKKQRARGGKHSSSSGRQGSGSGRISRSKSTRKGSSSSNPGGIGGFFGSLFGAKKKKPTSATVRRALSKPGQHRSHSSSANVHRRPTAARKESSRRR